jgi:hypothetical protein
MSPVAAIDHALNARGRSVLFAPTDELVQDLFAAKREFVSTNLARVSSRLAAEAGYRFSFRFRRFRCAYLSEESFDGKSRQSAGLRKKGRKDRPRY